MYSKRNNLILGFHGCDRDVRDKIVKQEDNQYFSKNDYDWLGHGMYFWENNPQRVYDYAVHIKNHPERCTSKIEEPSVLGAIIDLGLCLDLYSNAFLRFLLKSDII
jgi:hypothetical protein